MKTRVALLLVLVLAFVAVSTPAYARTKVQRLTAENRALSKQVKALKAQVREQDAAIHDVEAWVGGVWMGGYAEDGGWRFGEFNEGQWVSYVYAERFIQERGLWHDYSMWRVDNALGSVED